MEQEDEMKVIIIIIALIILSEVIKRIRKNEWMAAVVKKALGIKSPSKIWLDPGHGGCNEKQKS